MVVRVTRLGRIGILCSALCVAVILSWSSIRAAVAEHYEELLNLHGLQRATEVEPRNSKYWHLLGRYFQEDLEAQDLRRSIECYHTSLSLDPRSADVWLDLAGAYESLPDLAAARAAYLEAKRLYPSSAVVAWRYGNFLFRQNELAGGLLEVRHAVEGDARLGLPAFLECRHWGLNMDVILGEALPPIPRVYLDVLWQLTDERDTDIGLKVWAKLVALRPKLQIREPSFFVDGLLNSQRASEALRIWREALSLTDLPPMDDVHGLIWDGGFETNVLNGGLAWRIEPDRMVRVSFDDKIKHSGARSLRIDIAEKDISGLVGVCQSVVIEPGAAYDFSAWIRTRAIPQEGGFFLRLFTRGAQAGQTVSTSKLDGTSEWTQVSATWTSPDQSHLAQVCLARLPAFQQLPGTVWVDDVSLVKHKGSVR
jgi:tetratricopeptide (TPR) repeat protein